MIQRKVTRMSNITNQQHHNEPKIGNQELPSPNHESVCEGFGCSERATQEIKLSVGTLGKITLNICGKCQSKFIAKSVSVLVTPIKKSQYPKSLVSRHDQSIANLRLNPGDRSSI